MEEKLIQTDMEQALSTAFLNYAGYNLQRRAIPDVRDGFKWGGRQLIHSQMLGGFTYNKPFKKAAKSVSQAMGFSYVHGDASAYGTFIRMAKPFSYRYPLQEANGNYGTLINPDDHSASRYVELRGSELAAYALKDLDKNTITEWEDTYDLEGKFPKVLPSKGFYNIVNGCISIGSGMSCSIPPTNLKEVNNALIVLLKNPEAPDDEILCYPDFPTGATILNKEEVRQSMLSGSGKACKVRAKVEYDYNERCFIVKEMPYSTFTNTICNELATLMEEQSDCGIKNFVDYTGIQPDLRIYLEKKANPDKVLKNLYKNTSLQTFYTINMVMLDHGTTPKTFGWRAALQAHIDHEKIVYRRGFEFDLAKIEKRIHILDGLLIAIANVTEVVHTIKSSPSTAVASKSLQEKFLLDEEQAKAVLDMKLSRLANLEVKKLEEEKEKLQVEAARINNILNNEELFNKELIKGWQEVAEKFGDARRTQILNIESESDEPTEKKQLSLSFTNKGAVFVTETSTLYSQRRNGVGSKFKLEKEEIVIDNIVGENTETVLFFTNKGDYYHMKMGEFIIGEKQYLSNFFTSNVDTFTAAVSLNPKNKDKFIVFVTKNGLIKKSKLSEYNLKKNVGAAAIKLDNDDEIVSIFLVEDERIGIMSHGGQFIMVESTPIKPIGRVTRGIIGIKLGSGDYVVGARSISKDTTHIFSISEEGSGKSTSIKEFGVTGTNTKGVKIQKADNMCDFLPINSQNDILINTTNSQLRIKYNDIPTLSRGTQGTSLVKLTKANLVNVTQL